MNLACGYLALRPGIYLWCHCRIYCPFGLLILFFFIDFGMFVELEESGEAEIGEASRKISHACALHLQLGLEFHMYMLYRYGWF